MAMHHQLFEYIQQHVHHTNMLAFRSDRSKHIAQFADVDSGCTQVPQELHLKYTSK